MKLIPVTACSLCLLMLSTLGPARAAAPLISDGSDGPLAPTAGLVTLDLPADGVFNFTTIDIPEGTLLKFNRNAANTPVYLLATGDVVIAGQIDVSAAATDVLLPPVPENPKRGGGPGGFDGGLGASGDPTAVGADGDGPGCGGGGYSAGGAGNAGEGLQATRYSSTGGLGLAGGVVPLVAPLVGGSGGGGGSAVNWFGWYAGGYGGGGGGALHISTPGTVTITGCVLANGANGGWAYASALAHGGAGGGGAGGNIEIHAGGISLAEGALLQARGGYGGGLSTQPYSNDPAAYSSGAEGGPGYLYLDALAQELEGLLDGVYVDGTVSAAPEPLTPTGSLVLDNRPNPFNPRTIIRFEVPSEGRVWLEVLDLRGRRVRSVIAGGIRTAGVHLATWNGRDDSGRLVAAGTYFCRLRAAGGTETKRMLLLK